MLTAYYAVHHTLVKGALFLGIGILAAAGGPRCRLVFLPMAVLALSLGGMPLTSGALAKLAVKPMLGSGFLAGAMTLAGIGSTALMTHFLLLLAGGATDKPVARPRADRLLPWLVVAVASFVIPWSLYPAVSGETLASLLHPAALWKTTWPLLLGIVATFLVHRLPRLRGSVPEGDIVVLALAGEPAIRRLSDGIERADLWLRRWPVAGLWLLWLAILLGGILVMRV